MELTGLLAILLGALLTATRVTALSSTDAKTMYDAFNNAFLTTYDNGTAFYKRNLTSNAEDGSWTLDQDIYTVQDAYETTGDADKLSLMTDLLNTWLYYNPPPYDGDGWNDDVGWYTLALMRGYMYTGNTDWFNPAKSGYDMAFARGWNETYNNGGIWECQPAPGDPPSTKCVLSNFSLGRVACMIYQATHDINYLNQCEQIYNWVWWTLFVPHTGQVIGCVIQTGELQYGDDAYNQGMMADMANMLWLITGNENYLRDAKMALSYGFSNVTKNGIFTSWNVNGTGWVDDFSRGAGRTIQNNRLWDTYHKDMVNNADSILANRRADLGITWNAWDTPTPEDIDLWPTQANDASTWLLWTPVDIPDVIGGIHTITNVATGQAIDSANNWSNDSSVIQSSPNAQQQQRWLFTQNSDASWNIVNLATWKALDVGNGNNATNSTIIQSQFGRASNQRWLVEQEGNGTYKIENQQSQLVLDTSGSKVDGYPLIQWPWNNGTRQLWTLG